MNEEENELSQGFRLPQSLLDKLYSHTGDSDRHKGMMLVYISQGGDPIVYTKFGDKPSEVCILSTTKDFIEQLGNNQFQGGQ